MISSAVPLSAIADALWKILPHTTSSQLALLHEMRRTLPDALAARCDEIEKGLKPAAVAPRALAGPSRAREEAPSPRRLMRRVRRRRAAGAAGVAATRRALWAWSRSSRAERAN